ncbi:unnamed protein product [Rotaria sp. Silwood2]|nr:unnamed protein product [Rotaria sp. Silwood2]
MTRNDLLRTDGDIDIQITKYVPQVTQTTNVSEPSIETTLVFGSYVCQIDILFIQTFRKLSLCDIVLININVQDERRRFFAVIVHVVDHWSSGMENVTDICLTECDNNKHVIQVKSDVVLYASKACSDDIENHCRSLGSQKILIIKLTNITSPRRQISAIYNLRTFSKQESLLKPSNTDPYFHHENLLTAQSRALGNFDDAHMRVINYVERIFGDNGNGIDHLHLVHDPPGLVLFLWKAFC